jgi:Holliday junction resolvase RusA-like endonuclease
MKKKGLIEDDRFIKKITAEKIESDEFKIEIVENML